MEEQGSSSTDNVALAGMEMGKGGLVTARGTGEGLVLRLDGKAAPDTLRDALADFVRERKKFLTGQEILLEWTSEVPEYNFLKDITENLNKDYNIVVKESKLFERQKMSERSSTEDSSRKSSLFDGIEEIGGVDDGLAIDQFAEKGQSFLEDQSAWDDPDARIVVATLRSGQKIETEHSIVICGDINSGAEVTAGGDIIVLGTLRGVAHAGAYDESGGGRFIFAINLQPTQLRIGSTITRGSTDSGRQPEIARVDGETITVEPYQAKQIVQSRTSRF